MPAFGWAPVIIQRTLYHGNSVYPYRIWLVMTCLCLCSKLKPRPEKQILCHSSFSDGIIRGLHRGSFAVRDHMRPNLGIISGRGIICGRGSFAALYRSNRRAKKRSSDGAHAWGEQKNGKKWGGGEPEGEGVERKRSFPLPPHPLSLLLIFSYSFPVSFPNATRAGSEVAGYVAFA